jgi:GxxExxY protein
MEQPSKTFTTEFTEDGYPVVRANDVTEATIGCALKVHSALGPGLLESAYHRCLVHELEKCGLFVESQLTLPIVYDELKIDAAYRVDIRVEGLVLVEIKAVEQILPVHIAQLLSYLQLSGVRIGLLLNFNVAHLKSGIKRLIR